MAMPPSRSSVLRISDATKSTPIPSIMARGASGNLIGMAPENSFMEKMPAIPQQLTKSVNPPIAMEMPPIQPGHVEFESLFPCATEADAPGPVGGVGSNGTNGGCDDWFMPVRVPQS